MNHEPLRYAHEEGHTDVCFSSDGSKFITCGADGDIRVWSCDEGSDPIHSCIGEWSLSVQQKGENLYVATASNDVQILTFPDGERNGVLERFVAPINQIALSKDNEFIALAGEDMEAKLFDLGSSQVHVRFDGLAGPCLSVAVTSQYLAASSGDGKLRIWDVDTKEILKEIDCFPKVNSFANAQVLCRIDFSPDGSYLAYPHENSVVILYSPSWSEYGILKAKGVANSYSIVQFSPCGNFLLATTIKGDFVFFSVTSKTLIGSSKHPNSTTICGFAWNPTRNGQIVYTDTQGQLGLASNCLDVPSIDDELFTENAVDFGDVQFESDDDNENAVSVEKLKKEVMGDFESELNFEAGSPSAISACSPKPPEVLLQKPFMPSSSPEHLNPRYLCWNEVGVIRCYGSVDDDDSNKSIEIEFHNSTFHNSMMLQNYQDYTIGSVSTAALVVANTKQIYVIPLNVTSKEWNLKLDDTDEEIILAAVSENLICFGTTKYLVNICTIFGIQRGVVSIPGPLVSMAAYQNSLLVAYHAGAARSGDQCINIKLIKFHGFNLTSIDIKAALGPEATLQWLGFTDMGTPAMMDSLGMLSFYPLSSNIWIPFCDTTKHMKSPSDGFFITSILESHSTVFGVKCKGSVYPTVTPAPTVCELNLGPPFVEPTTDKSQLEANLFAWSNLEVGDMGKKFIETGLKAFALACKNDMDQRALELVEMIENQQLLNLSTKYAIRMNKKLLVDKLMDLASKLTNDEDAGPSTLVSDTPTPPLSTINRKLTLSSIKRTLKNKRVLGESVSTPEPPSQTANTSDLNSTTTSILSTTMVNDTIIDEVPKNPFSKKKNDDASSNPLSLVNKNAGVDYAKENKKETMEKRKQPETSEPNKQKEKQRKLDRFMFSKRS